MKYVSPIVVFLALLFLMFLPQQTTQVAADKMASLPENPDAPLAVTSTPTPLPQPTDVPVTPELPPDPGLACLRVNFEVSGDVAQAGSYEVVEVAAVPWQVGRQKQVGRTAAGFMTLKSRTKLCTLRCFTTMIVAATLSRWLFLTQRPAQILAGSPAACAMRWKWGGRRTVIREW
ncbi:MAG: hypothetical protein H6656_17270 [Ardenticatenaceae bacterium]|nr:hypothetical protein [Ardenticatenaceae bacterium]